MNDGRDIRDKLYGATRRLAGGMGTLKERLRAALTPEVMALKAEDFPWPDLGHRFDAVISEIAPDRRKAAQVLLDALSQVLQQMKAVGHLDC